jgi:transposase-like protein
MELLNKEQRRAILKEYNVRTADDINCALKDMFGSLLQEALEAELDTELEYPKNGSIPQGKSNRRNGHTTKNVRSDRGQIDLSVPRDREGEFEPIIIKKHQKEVNGIEEQILTLYAKGVLVREIQDYLNRLYGVEVSPALISKMSQTELCHSFGIGRLDRYTRPMPCDVYGCHPLQSETGRSSSQ